MSGGPATGRRTRLSLGLVAIAVLVVGVWALFPAPLAPVPAGRTAAGPAPAAAPATVAPVVARRTPAAPTPGLAVQIDRIGAASSLVPLGLNPDRTVQVPPVDQPGQAGWYEYGPRPGDVGPAVLLGHVNGDGRPGVFSRLAELRPGDRVTVRRDGRALTFVVDRVEQVSKAAFPTARVYGDTPGPELRLITCGGALDRSARRYLGQVIAFARLAV